MTQPRVAFLGLGRMGTPMARHVLTAGHPLTVWNRSPHRADALTTDGARRASTPAEAAKNSDVVVLMLADPTAASDVSSASTVWPRGPHRRR